MQGGILRASILLIAAAAAMSVATVEAEVNGSESGHLSTSSKLLTDLSMAALNSPAVGLLDPLGITKQSRDNIVKAALRLPQPKDYIAAAIRLSLQQFKNVINGVADFAKLADDSLNRMAIDDCRELMNYAIEELQDSMTSVDECPLLSLVQRLSDLKNWLSAVLSYSNTCIDGFTKPDLQSGINGVLQNSIAHTGQALSIVSAIPQILTSLNPPQNQAVSARKGYPAAAAASSGSGSAAAAASSSGNDASSGETESNDSSSFSSSGEERRASSSDREHSFSSSSSGESTMVGGEEDTARNRRSLKGVHFPAWMKKSDRKMLMARNVGGRDGQVRGSVSVQPNVVVAKDGSGQYTNIADALKAYNPGPEGNGTTRYIIYVKAGVYDEDVLITRKQPNIFMYGDGPTKTIVTGKKCNRDGVSTFRTAPFGTLQILHCIKNVFI
ncbi:unnamed protein product [Cuscuta epithymum]|uniref:Pectinesterase n=1 Tax=Cuscuta epithymum TaxID=186058 RepID=A0AAV0F278_9ASTE|nr:unnamed protein product [Cuscuta epithymum]CAH9129591.1 unnamed protein product [Cuscuta epithymum]